MSVLGRLPRKLKASPPPGYIAVVEKDCLRVGKMHTDAGVWNVTGETLDSLVKQYRLYRKRGYKSNLVWNHEDGDTRAKVANVIDLVRRGDELVALIGVKTPKALSTLREQDEVSIYVDEHVDGLGNYYPQLLKHVGIVEHPVVNGQRPFKRILSRSASVKKAKRTLGTGAKKRKLATEGGEGEGEGGGSADDATEISVKEVVSLINEHFGATLPDDVDTVKELGIALKMLAGKTEDVEAEEVETDAATGMEGVEPMTAAALAKSGKVGLLAKKLAKENETLKAQIAEAKKRKLARAKKNFADELKGLVETGRITAAERTDLESEGKTVGYRLSILAGYKRLPENAAGTNRKRLASTGATGKPPGGRSDEDEDKRAKSAAEAILGRKLSTGGKTN